MNQETKTLIEQHTEQTNTEARAAEEIFSKDEEYQAKKKEYNEAWLEACKETKIHPDGIYVFSAEGETHDWWKRYFLAKKELVKYLKKKLVQIARSDKTLLSFVGNRTD